MIVKCLLTGLHSSVERSGASPGMERYWADANTVRNIEKQALSCTVAGAAMKRSHNHILTSVLGCFLISFNLLSRTPILSSNLPITVSTSESAKILYYSWFWSFSWADIRSIQPSKAIWVFITQNTTQQ